MHYLGYSIDHVGKDNLFVGFPLLLYTVCVPYPLMRSAKAQLWFSSFSFSLSSTPSLVTTASE